MLRAYSGTDVRAAEQPLLAAGQGPVLMQRAAHGLSHAVVQLLKERCGGVYGARIVVLVGSGNNGADALYAAAALAARGARATAVLGSAGVHAAALAGFRRAGGRTVMLPDPDAGGAGGHVEAERDTAGGGDAAGDGRADTAGDAAGDGEGYAAGNGEKSLFGDGPESAQADGGWLAEAVAADVLIDAVLGTGARGGLREPWAAAVRSLQNLSGPSVVACDLPSGVDADTGEVFEPVLKAGLTVTFGAAKTGLFSPPGEGVAGRVQVIGIGLEGQLRDPALRRLEAADLAALLPAPDRDDQKYTRGVLGIVAGSAQYPGAAQLSCAGALACGVGMVRYLGPGSVAALIHAGSPEVVCGEGTVANSRVQAWLAGPGISGDGRVDRGDRGGGAGGDRRGDAGGDDGQLRRCRDAFDSGLPVVADAGALTVLPANVGAHIILTPHAGELAQLLRRLGRDVSREQVEAQGMAHALAAAKLTGATVLLKGATTLVASPGGSVFSQSEGTPWLATAGSGDTLAGILGALLAALAEDTGRFSALGIAAEDRWAAIGAAAASLHGRAGALAGAGGPLHARDLATAVPRIWRRLRPPAR
ncbi:bifunctional ADP-dependent NAD(P)H-hydrate dehydratase/NAD(P)H-hydrate epimerase [Arthrobacter sp. A5]|uniref:bifunctional ADP-dependent NAD(P)H-hydrate dehydratase/NAD(P)H-hydrate epimerase n=1 Tax=Arthrobacter sp. A5 TaxID=576926 RepID=UPI003DAA47B4